MSEILQEAAPAEMPPPYVGIVAADDMPADSHALRIMRPGSAPRRPSVRAGFRRIFFATGTRDPYAYQTEEELMPAGGQHGRLMGHVMGVTDDFLGAGNLMFLADVFMLYRDGVGKKQRISPDLLLMPLRSPAPYSYDLDSEPPPALVAEITSPESRPGDMRDKISLYTGLGVPAYLVIDLYTSGGKLRDEIRLRLWRTAAAGVREVRTDAGGWLPLPGTGLKTRALGRELIFADIVTGEVLRSAGQEAALRRQETARAESAEEELGKLRAKLRAAGIVPD